jgi:YHS domain-containing protein
MLVNLNSMKTLKPFIVAVLLAAFATAPLTGFSKDKDAKPYPLTTCVVSGEKLGEMGKPYKFTQDGREIQLCCKSCLKDFKKDPAKYVKKLDEAEAKAAK